MGEFAGITEHGGQRFDAANAPAGHTQAVDHGGVRIGAHHTVGVDEYAYRCAISELNEGNLVPGAPG